jgi:RNA polymerase sigma factor (sigma-70 family)
MRRRQTDTILHGLSRLVEAQSERLTDGQLLNRFAATRDEGAFAALVHRHGPLVYGVCRNILRHEHDAEDAFQATFLVLARRAGAIREYRAIGSWLHRVAYRVSMKARTGAERRRRREDRAARPPEDWSTTELAWRELQAMLDEELNRLPGKYRAPFVLCCLAGKSKTEAAAELGWREGTVSSRLAQARTRLRARLARRGVALSAILSGLAISHSRPATAVPAGLVVATQQAAPAFAADEAVASGSADLARAMLRAGTLARLAIAGVVVAVVGLVGTATAVALHWPRPEGPEEPTAPAVALPAPANNMTVGGSVIGPDGKAVPGARVVVMVDLYPQPGELRVPSRVGALILGKGATDDSGEFRLAVPQTTTIHNRLTALASVPGFALSSVELNTPTITASEHKLDEIRLVRGTVARALVLDPDGRPARGVKIHVLGMQRNAPQLGILYHEPPVPIPGWPGPITTDAEGYLNIPDVVAGTKVTCQVRDDERFATDWLAFTTPDTKAQPPVLKLSPPRAVEGRVTAADSGLPLANTPVVVRTSMPPTATLPGVVEGCTDGQGRYRVRPFPGPRVTVSVHPHTGEPYPELQQEIEWPQGNPGLQVDLSTQRGVLIRGKVREEGSDRPVAGAVVHYNWADDLRPIPGRPGARLRTRDTRSGPDGTFVVAVPPGLGHLLVKATEPDYIHAEITWGELDGGRRGGHSWFPDAFVRFRVKPTDGPQEVTLRLRRGVTVRGRVVGSDGRPVSSAMLFSKSYIPASYYPKHFEVEGHNLPVRDGRFELPGCEPDAKVSVWIYDPETKEGAVAELPTGAGAEPEVRLAPCASARVRFVDAGGLPIPKPSMTNFTLVLRDGLDRNKARDNGTPAALELSPYRIHGRTFELAEAGGGYLVLPRLIPGALYAIQASQKKGPRDPWDWSERVTFTAPPTGRIDLEPIPIRPLR